MILNYIDDIFCHLLALSNIVRFQGCYVRWYWGWERIAREISHWQGTLISSNSTIPTFNVVRLFLLIWKGTESKTCLFKISRFGSVKPPDGIHLHIHWSWSVRTECALGHSASTILAVRPEQRNYLHWHADTCPDGSVGYNVVSRQCNPGSIADPSVGTWGCIFQQVFRFLPTGKSQNVSVCPNERKFDELL